METAADETRTDRAINRSFAGAAEKNVTMVRPRVEWVREAA